MKRAIYSFGNEVFTFFANRVEEELNARDIPHIFVGGSAVQAHILKRLTDSYDTDISTLASNEGLRFQDYIRATDDIDLALKFPEEDEKDIAEVNTVGSIRDFCDALSGEYISGTEKNIFSYELERRGITKPVFKIKIDEDEEERIFMNLSRKSKNLKKLSFSCYNEFIDAGSELVIPYSKDYNLKLTVPKLEHVLATKISQLRAKDLMDISNLVKVVHSVGEEVDLEELERILKPVHTKNYGQFLSLVGLDGLHPNLY
ncbi:hypothetical protein HOE04_00180 [archaeon]|jgi:hypothetical protein|nr:hypothetical protein [archaeon]